MTSWPATESREVAIRLPATLVLGAAVVLSAVAHAWLALASPSPWIFPDEIIYSELAKSIAAGGLPAIRDEPSLAYGLGYPLLLAPVWAFFDDVPAAYEVAKVWNAIIMSSTAIPAFLLARRFVPETNALVAAGLAIAVPSLGYAGTLMTEVALYPAFVLAVLAITRAVERPTLGAQCFVLGAITIAASIKVLALVLLLAYLSGVLLFHWLDTRDAAAYARRLGGYRATWLGLGAAVGVACVGAAAYGHTPMDLLGAYGVVVDNVNLRELPWWFLLHLAELDLYLAVLPLAATVCVIYRGLGRSGSHHERLFAAVVLPVMGLWLGVVAAFASTPFPAGPGSAENVARLHERGTFFLSCLLFIGFVMAPSGSLVSRRVVIGITVVAAALPAVIPLHSFAENTYLQALALFPWVSARDVLWWPGGVLVLSFGLATLYLRRVRLGLLVVPIVALMLVVGVSSAVRMQWSSWWADSMGVRGDPGWIDRAAGDEGVSVLWAERPRDAAVAQHARHRILWLGEFFNRRVGTVYELGAPTPYGLPSSPVHLRRGLVVGADDRPIDVDGLVLVPCHVRVEGIAVARHRPTEASVVRIRHPLRATVLDPAKCGPQSNW